MKLVVLDGYLVGFDGLRPQLGHEHQLVWYDHTEPHSLVSRIGDAQAVVVNRAFLGEEVFAACPGIRYVGTLGTGYNIIDLAAAGKRGIPVCNAPGYSEAAVAQGTFALLLELAGSIGYYSDYVRRGGWTDPVDPALTAAPTMELAGKTLGIIGLGSIGAAVARIAAAFGMKVAACRRPGDSGKSERNGVPLLELEELLATADIVSLHCPLNEETRGLIGEDALSRMKDGTILLNTARGALLEEAAVARALDSGKLSWLGADVLAQEPPDPDNPLARHPRALITPHITWMPRETRQRLLDVMAGNFLAFCRGEPSNVVNQRFLVAR